MCNIIAKANNNNIGTSYVGTMCIIIILCDYEITKLIPLMPD